MYTVTMASVLLLLPDELLAEVDAIRPHDRSRLEWIRTAISHEVTMAQVRREAGRGAPESPGRFGAPLPTQRATQRRTIVRQGTLPGGAMCAHPFRDATNKCRTCGVQR
jgi:hypothetical protein